MSLLLALALSLHPDPDFVPVEPTISDAVLELSAERSEMPAAEWIARLDALGEAGDFSAWELLGELYAAGSEDVARDPARACDYFERIGTNRGDALHSAAGCYFIGDGREQDYERARELYRQAIDAGYVTSLCGLGTMLVNGQGGPAEPERGVALCELAAEHGDIDAMTDLGGFLLMGVGVERDPVEARGWLEQAGAQGQANAAHLMGQILTRGDGIAADHGAAARWFRIAHDAGRPDASWQLALSLARTGMRPDGDRTVVVPETMREAREWALDAAQRHPDAAARAEAADFAANITDLLARVED